MSEPQGGIDTRLSRIGKRAWDLNLQACYQIGATESRYPRGETFVGF